MAVSLLETFQTHLTSDVLQQISAFIGEDPARTETAVQAAVPSLLAGLRERMSTTTGSERVMSLINQVGTRLDVATLLAGSAPPFADLATLGSGLLAAIFGGNLASINETLANIAGMPAESALSLLSLLTSIVLGVLGREVSEQHLAAADLASMLESQRDEINAFVPAALAMQMAASPTLLMDAPAPATATRVAQSLARPRRSRLAWLVPVAAVGIIAATTGWCYLRPQGLEERRAAAFSPSSASDTTPAPTPTPPPAAATPAPASTPAPTPPLATPEPVPERAPAVKSETLTLPGGRRLKMEEGSGNYALQKFLASASRGGDDALPKSFTFERLSFENNSADLMRRSDHMVTELIEILKAYPTAEVRIEGHTDSHGNSERNKTLSLVRAQAIKAKLVAGGIAESRVTAEGVGQDQPIASNNTAEGRRHNRRIDVVVTKR
jgi:OOP family OmpA-OmpF porin